MTFDELLILVSSDNRLNVRTDSRCVEDGDIFVAVNGTVCDGHDFIDQAIDNGAKFIVSQKPCGSKKVEVVFVNDSSTAAAVLAQAGRDCPSSKLTNLAVTGTNGKTTTAFLVRSIIQSAGQKCGLISTVIYDNCGECKPAALTTPDCLTVAEQQQKMVEAGAKFMVIEASSQALHQNRLAAVDFKAAAFTNLTGDHLDYHKTKENYLAAKIMLFERLSSDAVAVLNKQSSEAKQIAAGTKAKILWYAVDAPADITAHIETMDIDGTVFTLEHAGQKQKVKTPLLGLYNISNNLAATGLCLAAGFGLKTIAEGLAAVPPIPGRLEKVDTGRDFSVLVDYAHTDDALQNVLTTLKPLCKGRLIIVFGCGGDRDKTKRPRMARVAEQLADMLVITSDNPRTEQPAAIIGDIMTGLENPTADTIFVELDRKKAVNMAIEKAAAGDIILIAGKGHETYQIIGNKKTDFSDKKTSLDCLKKPK
jgi:UDP-N-acetylmuramoyl-L-alanyl-D-glutamate--2,6-diaminopimelate ligase